MRTDFQKLKLEPEPARDTAAFQRLARLKGKIWALTLEEAEKYYELAEFVSPVSKEEHYELEKIKFHLQKRVDKLTRREVFEKAQSQQKMNLQLLDKELERARASRVSITSSSKFERGSASIVTLKELDCILEPLQSYNGQTVPTETFFEQEAIEEQAEAESKQCSLSGIPELGTYPELYQNIAELDSTVNTQLEILSFDEDESKVQDPRARLLSPRRRVFRNLMQSTKTVLSKFAKTKKHL